MRVVGIVAEYNPFHNGHLYQLEQARKNADLVVVAMSGSFVQRGDVAAYDKWMRCHWALRAGADMVLELPTAYVLQSARGFASGAIATLAAAGCNALSFGTESDDSNALREAALLSTAEDSEFRKHLQRELKRGKSYPRARHAALLTAQHISPEVASYLKRPNFLLAAEYIHAIETQKLDMELLPIIRRGEGHDAGLDADVVSQLPSSPDTFISASSVRALCRIDPSSSAIAHSVPAYVNSDIRTWPISDFENLENVLLYALRNTDREDLSLLFGADEGLEYLLQRAGCAATLDEAFAICKSKRYTLARIRRLFCAVMLDISSDLVYAVNQELPPYIRLLGFRDTVAPLLQTMSEGAVPVLARKHDFDQLHGIAEDCLALDLRATSLQSLSFPDPDRRRFGRDFSERVIVYHC